MKLLSLPPVLEDAARGHSHRGREHTTGSPPSTSSAVGSGDARPDSDLDVAVQLNSPADALLADFILAAGQWRGELSRLVPYAIDLQLADRREAPKVWGYLCAGCARVYPQG
jgi:hypothetical protein